RAVLLDRRVKRVRPALEVRYQLRERHESVWVRARILGAGKLDAPVRGHEAEGIPATRPPCLGDATGIEDDVVDVGLGEVPAGGQACLAGADDRDVDP